MLIRTRLSLYFTIISAILLLIVLLAINLLFTKHTREDFFKALKERAIVTAQVYLEADEITDSSLKHFKEEYLNTLPDEVIRMYDMNRRPAFVSDPDHSWSNDLISKVINDKYLELDNEKKQAVGIRYDDNQGSFVILVSASDKAGKERAKVLVRNTMILYVLQLLVLFFAGRWFAQKVLQPVQKINHQVQEINATDLHLRVDEGNGKDEISELGINFNQLLRRLESSFEIQKTFVNNASHELRTPLTSIIGEIEVAIANSRAADEYKRALQSVLLEAEKLNNQIDGLLSLASTENSIALKELEPVRLDSALWAMEEQIKKKQPDLLLNIHLVNMPDDERKLFVLSNKNLLDLAFANIVRNAFKFSYNQPVDVTLEYSPGGITVKVADKGIGISKQDLKNVYHPFYRSAEAHQFEGQGMGLYIAKRIFDLTNAEMTIQSIPGKGTIVVIYFRKKSAF